MSHTTPRRGLTLLEIAVAVTLVSVFVLVALPRLNSSTQADLSAQGDARRLALDLLQAQRRAITTGDNHFVQFTSSGGKVVGYTLYRRTGGTTSAVDAYHAFNTLVTPTVSHTDLEYQFDGSALAAYQVTLAGPNQSWRVTVTTLTGAVQVVKL